MSTLLKVSLADGAGSLRKPHVPLKLTRPSLV